MVKEDLNHQPIRLCEMTGQGTFEAPPQPNIPLLCQLASVILLPVPWRSQRHLGTHTIQFLCSNTNLGPAPPYP